MKYKEWLSEWLENYVGPTSKAKTYSRYSQIIRCHLSPRLGNYEMEELTPQLLQQQIVDMSKSGNQRTGKGLAPSTLNLIVAVIQGSLETAFSIGLCQTYAADKIKRPRIEEKKVQIFTVHEQKVLEEAIKKAYAGTEKVSFGSQYYRSDIGQRALMARKD